MMPSGALKLCTAPAGQRVGGGAKDATPESFPRDDFAARNEREPSASLRLCFPSSRYQTFTDVDRPVSVCFQFWFVSLWCLDM